MSKTVSNVRAVGYILGESKNDGPTFPLLRMVEIMLELQNEVKDLKDKIQMLQTQINMLSVLPKPSPYKQWVRYQTRAGH